MENSNSSYRLKKNERLNSKKSISRLFENGRYFSGDCLRAVCISQREEDSGVQVLFSVSKKHFKNAVKRNLLKRRIREAYRLHKQSLTSAVEAKKCIMLIGFLYITSTVKTYHEIENDMTALLKKLENSLDK